MSEKLIYLLQRLMRKTWVRCMLFSLFALLAVGLAMLLGPSIPEDVALKLGSDSIESLLNILAASMLTVAIFSASTMVSSFSAVASSATPRASQLLIQDTTIQNTLATFIGAFLYSVIALIGLNAQIYGDGGRLVLFGFTIVILLLVVIVLLRWIDYLSVLGRMGETIRRVETATLKAMTQRLSRPYMGARPQPEGAAGLHTVFAPETGFVQHVSMDLLQACTEEDGDMLHLHVLPGAFVEPSVALVSSDRPVDEARRKAICNAVLIGSSRTFDHDPRFGLVVMGEIATRALSPGINDPGTALDVMATSVRVLVRWVEQLREDGEDGEPAEVEFDRVTAPALREAGMLEDVFMPLARYGETAVEVGVTLQRALASIRRLDHPAFKQGTEELSRYAIERAAHAGLLDADVQQLREAAALGRQPTAP
ncbi:DUF2254 domain-containing protein [soil metagenome]